MKGICVNFIALNLLFRFLKGRCHGNQFFGKIGEMTFIQHAVVPKRIRISQFLLQVLNGIMFCYTLCNFDEDIGPVTPEIVTVEIALFG